MYNLKQQINEKTKTKPNHWVWWSTLKDQEFKGRLSYTEFKTSLGYMTHYLGEGKKNLGLSRWLSS